MNKRTLGVAAVFLVGCAVGGASSQLVVPKASAQQAASLTKWEHHCVEIGPRNIARMASELGDQGWEVVAVDKEFTWCFKRPKM
jgi:hypothetical protein